MTDLDALIAAVEAGSHEWDATFLDRAEDDAAISLAVLGAYLGSLDAAKRLHDALLPGWFVTITRLCDEFDTETVKLVPSDWLAEVSDGWRGWPDDDDPDDHFQSADCADPARAWLLAILRAVKAKG